MGPVDTHETLGARLKYVREKVLGWSARKAQQELSASGVDIESHTTVLRYEKDRRVPGADYVAVLAERAGVTTDWILTGTGPRERPTRDSGDPYLAGQVAVLDRLVTQLTAELADARRQAASLRDAGTEDARRDGSAQ